MVDFTTNIESKMIECLGMDNHDEKIRADERRKFAEWLSENKMVIDCQKGYLSSKEILLLYAEKMKGGAE